MWVIFTITTLLIRAIVGNLEIDSLSGQSKFGGQNNDAFGGEIERAIATEDEEIHDHLNTSVSGNDRLEGGNYEAQKSTDVIFNKGILSDTKVVSKRSESAPASSWLYLPTKNKIISIDGFQGLSQEKKSPAFSPWGGKRVSFYRSTRIRRPIRVPFNSWGGKRGKEYLDANIGTQAKRNKLTYDQNDHGDLLDGLEAKRTARRAKGHWKVPFNSWGGKRSQEPNNVDRNQFMLIVDNDVTPNDNQDHNSAKASFSKHENVEYIDDKRSGSKDNKARVRFHSWGGKRDGSDYQNLSNISNETVDDYTTEDDIGENDWLISVPNKRMGRVQFRRQGFNPWGGKRSSKAYAFRLADDYSGIPAELARGRQVFYPWGG